MRTVALLLLVPASAGVISFLLSRRFGSAAGWLVWSVFMVGAFILLRPWYVGNSNCDGPGTIYVPLVGAFAAASGAWVGITRGRNVEHDYSLLRVGLESAMYALVPGAFFVLLLWPCG